MGGLGKHQGLHSLSPGIFAIFFADISRTDYPLRDKPSGPPHTFAQ